MSFTLRFDQILCEYSFGVSDGFYYFNGFDDFNGFDGFDGVRRLRDGTTVPFRHSFIFANGTGGAFRQRAPPGLSVSYSWTDVVRHFSLDHQFLEYLHHISVVFGRTLDVTVLPVEANDTLSHFLSN